MLFSDHPRTQYPNHQLREVICQLRFPTILSINNTEPADFQEMIRDAFPQYVRRQEAPPPLPGANAAAQAPISNYHFLSADGRWKLNLTRDFIALSTLHYGGWEEFARHLDRPLAAFIQLYKPAFFQRVGLRYLNVFSRRQLDLKTTDWAELFSPTYLGVLAEEDVREENIAHSGCDLQVKLDSSSLAKIHSGLGRLKSNTPGVPEDPEVKFILDMDLSMQGNTPCTLAAAGLETLHGHSTRLFEGAIRDPLRHALSRT